MNEDINTYENDLEDVFLHLTTEEQDEGPIILNEASQAEQLHHKKYAAELDNE